MSKHLPRVTSPVAIAASYLQHITGTLPRATTTSPGDMLVLSREGGMQ